ncbi:hypothetical protein BDQ17DRAFT_784403 [Cyathus striatus]|nr:hypothetical protein BDQ17DRAFT_784403 [Cyathus striatus]
MGEVRLIVVGKGTKKVVGEMLDMDDSEDVVDVGRWEGDVIRASTDWIEHLDAHGLEKYEALKNVEVRVIEVLDDEEDDIIQDHITTLKETIQQPFQVISDVLHPEGQPSAVLANLLSSSSTPLYTALILLVDNPPTIQQTTLLTSLSPVIPIIPFSTSRRLPPTLSLPGTSPFHPDNTHALQRLFRPDTLNLLRSEAADKFLKWREVHRTVAQIERQSQSSNTSTKIEVDEGEEKGWDKQKWELEYLHTLSLDVARMRARSSTITPSHSSFTNHSSCLPSSSSVSAPPGTALGPIDPLHLPSLILFSLSLLGPLKHSVIRMFREAVGVLGDGRVRAALVSGVVVGFGVGLGVGR